jgi:glyoxalase-like protein
MPERIDHVIVAAADLAHLEAAFTRLGFHVVGGGEHPHLSTRNRIILLDQGYIELLAIANEQVVSPAVRQRIATAPGWIGFALQSADIVTEAADMRARGAAVRGPHPGKLVAPDGSVRSWQTVTIGGDDLFSAAEPIPFLIQHDSNGVKHQQELAGADTIVPHPNGALRLQAVVVATTQFSIAEEAFSRDYGMHAANPAAVVPVLAAEARALPLRAAGERVVLAQPLVTGIVNDRLTSAGEGVCCVSVTVVDLAATRDYLQQSNVPHTQWEDGLMISAAVTGGAPLAFVNNKVGEY